jgi:hypothetical protein
VELLLLSDDLGATVVRGVLVVVVSNVVDVVSNDVVVASNVVVATAPTTDVVA